MKNKRINQYTVHDIIIYANILLYPCFYHFPKLVFSMDLFHH